MLNTEGKNPFVMLLYMCRQHPTSTSPSQKEQLYHNIGHKCSSQMHLTQKARLLLQKIKPYIWTTAKVMNRSEFSYATYNISACNTHRENFGPDSHPWNPIWINRLWKRSRGWKFGTTQRVHQPSCQKSLSLCLHHVNQERQSYPPLIRWKTWYCFTFSDLKQETNH